MKINKYLLGIICCCFQFNLLAQIAVETVAVETIEVDSIWKYVNLDDVVVTAQYAPTATENAVHQVKVIKAAEILEQGQVNLAEVLTNQLNLRVDNDRILGSGLRIQGIGGENIQIMIDGVPVIGRLGGNIDLSQINLQNIERIEIIEGAMSAQYGSNASGGVINLITKKSQVKKFQVHSQNQYEDIGILNNSLTLSTQMNNTFASVTAFRNEQAFGPVDSLRLIEEVELRDGRTIDTKVIPWNPKTQRGLDVTLRQDINATTLTYQYRNFNEVLTIYDEIRDPLFFPYSVDETYTTNRIDHSFNIESNINNKFYLNSTTAYNQFERLKKTEKLDFIIDSTGYVLDTTSLILGGQDTTTFNSFLHRSILSSTFNSKLNGQLGIEILDETGSGGRIVDSTSAPFDEAEITNYALWASVQYQFAPSAIIQGNVRYGYNTKYDHPLIPSVNISWKPQNKWDIQLSYAYGFRAPSLKELHFNFIDANHYIIGNRNLKAENSQNASLSITKRAFPVSDDVRISVSGKVFYNKVENRIVLAEFEPFRLNYQNIDNFETHGFNFQLQLDSAQVMSVKTGLAYTRLLNPWSAEFETDKFTGLFEMQNEFSLNIPTFKLVVMHRYIGKQVRFFLDDGELKEGFIGGFSLINVTLSRSLFKDRVFLALGSKNILDKQRVPILGGGGGAHSVVGDTQLLNWGRTLFARVNLKF
ncbi:MAG: TonB-dependent receptor [Bacteroidota bacterium]